MNLPPNQDGNPQYPPGTQPVALPNALGLPLGPNLLFHPQALASANLGALFPTGTSTQHHALINNPQLTAMNILGLPLGLGLNPGNFVPVPLPTASTAPQTDTNSSDFMSSIENMLKAAGNELDMGQTRDSKLPRSSSRPISDSRPESTFTTIPRQAKSRAQAFLEEEDFEDDSDDASISVSKDAESAASDVDASDSNMDDINSAGKRYGTRSKERKSKSSGGDSTRSRKGVSGTKSTDQEYNQRMKLRSRATLHPDEEKWGKLELVLPSIPVPVSNGLSLPHPKARYESSLHEIDHQAPTFAMIDSPSIWRASAAPLHAEYLQNVLYPAFISKYDPKLALPLPSRTASRISQTPASTTDSSLISSTSNATTSTKQRKKRAREGETNDTDEHVPSGDSTWDPPVNKRSKSSEKGDLGVFEADTTERAEDEAEESTKIGTTKRRRKSEVSEIKRDSEGKPILPLKFGSLELVALGKVMIGNDRFWSRRYIFPVGYISRRPYYSVKFPDTKCYYVQELLASESEPVSPIFKLTCEDEPDNPIFGASASSVWATLLDRIRPQREQIMGRPLNSSISGPEQYGFSHPTIHSLIEALPGASDCIGHDPMGLYEKKSLKEA